jgi:hypothetical protein
MPHTSKRRRFRFKLLWCQGLQVSGTTRQLSYVGQAAMVAVVAVVVEKKMKRCELAPLMLQR